MDCGDVYPRMDAITRLDGSANVSSVTLMNGTAISTAFSLLTIVVFLAAPETLVGAFLDPVADKLMVVVAIVLLVEANPSIWLAIPSIIIISREITVSALREWMAELGKRATVKVSLAGKLKTIAQLVSLILMIYREPFLGLPIYEIGLTLFYLAAFLTLYSMGLYLRAAWPVITRHG